jgi:hypothetical protein
VVLPEPHAASEHRVERRHTGGDAILQRRVRLRELGRDKAWVDVEPAIGDSESVHSFAVLAAAQLSHAQVALVTCAELPAAELDDSVGDRELRHRRNVLFPVLADQERRRLVRRQQAGELVQHVAHRLD